MRILVLSLALALSFPVLADEMIEIQNGSTAFFKDFKVLEDGSVQAGFMTYLSTTNSSDKDTYIAITVDTTVFKKKYSEQMELYLLPIRIAVNLDIAGGTSTSFFDAKAGIAKLIFSNGFSTQLLSFLRMTEFGPYGVFEGIEFGSVSYDKSFDVLANGKLQIYFDVTARFGKGAFSTGLGPKVELASGSGYIGVNINKKVALEFFGGADTFWGESFSETDQTLMVANCGATLKYLINDWSTAFATIQQVEFLPDAFEYSISQGNIGFEFRW